MGCGVLVWLASPAALNAQFSYTTNDDTITITGYTGPGGNVVIPDTISGLPVVTIGKDAFRDCTTLTGVTIPETVSSIGSWAFSGTGLSTVTFPDGLVEIGYCAFYGCTNLVSVVMSDSLIWLDAAAFGRCTSLTSITLPDTLRSVEGGVFQDCYSLTTVIIGRGVTSIGEMAFHQCINLTGVFFEGNGFDLVPFRWYAFDGVAANATAYYLPGRTGWGPTFGGLPTAPWALPAPLILTLPPDFGVGTNGFGFIISWATNATVVVEACTDLAVPEWSPVGTNTLVDGWSYFSDPEWTNYAHSFYRLRSP